MARPSEYTPEMAEAICQRLSDGESLRQICRDEGMPAPSTVMRWLRQQPEFRAQYAHAREMLLEHWAEEILEVADDGSNDWVRREDEKGRVKIVLDDEHVRRSALRIDTRKWLLSKLAPKKYGEKVQHTGEDGQPMTLKIIREVVRAGTERAGDADSAD